MIPEVYMSYFGRFEITILKMYILRREKKKIYLNVFVIVQCLWDKMYKNLKYSKHASLKYYIIIPSKL